MDILPVTTDAPQPEQRHAEHGVRYFATILWAFTEYGTHVPIKTEFRVGDITLSQSSWLDNHVLEFVSNWSGPVAVGRVYQFDGIYYINSAGVAFFEGTTAVCDIRRGDAGTWLQ